MQSLLHGAADGDGSLARWLRWGLPSVAALRAEHPVARAAAADGRGEVDQLSMVNVAHQIEVLTEHPTLAATVAAGRVRLVGLFFDIPSAAAHARRRRAAIRGAGRQRPGRGAATAPGTVRVRRAPRGHRRPVV
jgi:carbonic anhydrase